MSNRRALVIAVDGLRASALGAYGNTTFPTPAFDALASQSTVVEWMWCTSGLLSDFYRGAWQRRPAEAMEERDAAAPPRALAERLSVSCELATDDRWVAEEAARQAFGQIQHVEMDGSGPAAAVEDTALARLFAVAMERLLTAERSADPSESDAGSKLLWLHASGFRAPWDAPRPLVEQLLEDDEQGLAELGDPLATESTDDPDRLLQYRAAYAAQAMVLDECVGALLAALAESGRDQQTLVVVVGCRGLALGEHGQVGAGVESLYSELVHVPCLIRKPGVDAPPPRAAGLAQPSDLFDLLRDWFNAGAGSTEPSWLLAGERGTSAAPPQYIVSAGQRSERAVRTPAWMLRRAPAAAGDQQTTELYAKPFDRWEANEISDRRPDVTERLQALLDAGDASTHALDADLVEPPD